MAIDNTPPRLRLISTIAVIVVITLIGLDFVFKSYYAFMSDAAQHEKLAPRTAQIEQNAAEKAAWAGAKIPLEQAAAQLKASRPELVEPKQSEDMAPMTGWAKLPKQAPLAMPSSPTPMHPPTPDMAADGGAHAGDAGAADPHAAADAGAHPAPKPAARDAGAKH
jgi:hypothetical protein